MTTMTGPPRLTAAHLQVLRGLAAGWTVSEIAARLHLSESGVSMRIQRATRALGARTTAQAIHVAARRGLLDEVPTP